MINYKFIDFRFIDCNDLHNTRWNNWSRNYEWEYVIKRIKDLNINSIHNTACGGMNESDCLHLTFCNELIKIVPETINSDIWGDSVQNEYTPKIKPNNNNFIYYNLYNKYDNKFDMVLCISVLEHLHGNIKEVFMNLWEQVKEGGTLILTFDYPIVDLKLIEEIVGKKCINTLNPIFNPHLNLNIVYLELCK